MNWIILHGGFGNRGWGGVAASLGGSFPATTARGGWTNIEDLLLKMRADRQAVFQVHMDYFGSTRGSGKEYGSISRTKKNHRVDVSGGLLVIKRRHP